MCCWDMLLGYVKFFDFSLKFDFECAGVGGTWKGVFGRCLFGPRSVSLWQNCYIFSTMCLMCVQVVCPTLWSALVWCDCPITALVCPASLSLPFTHCSVLMHCGRLFLPLLKKTLSRRILVTQNGVNSDACHPWVSCSKPPQTIDIGHWTRNRSASFITVRVYYPIV